MHVIVEDLARESLEDLYYYNCRYSLKNADETDININQRIHNLEDFPYIGRYIPEISDKRFREIIYKKTKQSGYRIMYYSSEPSDTIYVFNIINCKQDFKHMLKLHNYFKNHFKF